MNYKITPMRFLTGVFILLMTSISFNALTNGSGGPAGNTAAPYVGSNNHCGRSGCHSTSLSSNTTFINNITLTGSYVANGGYAADSTYSMTLKYVHQGKSKFGFQLVPLYSSGDSMAGDLTSGSGNKVVSHNVSGQAFKNLTHTSSGTSGNDSIEWNFEWTAPDRIVGTVEFYVVINATNSNGNASGDIIIQNVIEVNPGGVPESTITADTNVICFGEQMKFYGSATDSATGYEWRFPNGSPSTSTDSIVSVSYNIPGNHTAYLKAKNKYGFGQEVSYNFTVRPALTAFIGGASTRSICDGDSVQILANFVPGQVYNWSNGESGSNSIWAKDTGDYYVTVSRNGCERVSNVIRVNFKAKPSATLSSDASSFGDTACVNSEIELQTQSGFDSFYYYNSSGMLLGRTASNTFTTTFTGSTSYGLRVLSSTSGCLSDLATYDVEEKARLAAPTVTCDSSTADWVRYKWSVSYSTTGFVVSTDSGQNWTNPSSGSTGLTHEISGLQPEQRTELWVRALDGQPCGLSEIGTQVCFSDTCNSLEFTINAPDSVCAGDEVEIVINGLSNANFATYLGVGGPSTDTIYTVVPTVSRTYNILVQDSNYLECPLESKTVTIHADEITDNTVSFDQTVYCEGDQVEVTGESSMDNYTFFVNGSSVQSGSSDSYTSSDLVYGDSVRIELSLGKCVDSGMNVAVPVDSMPTAAFTQERFGPNYVFTPADENLMTYHWDFGDGDTSVDVMPVHDYSASQNQTVDVTLAVTNDNECGNSNTESVSVPDMSSIEQLKALGLDIYPNPVGDELTIRNQSGKVVEVVITDIKGQIIYSGVIEGTSMSLNTTEWASGTYFIELNIDETSLNHKVVKH